MRSASPLQRNEEVDRAGTRFSDQARDATRRIEPLISQYGDRVMKWIRNLGIIAIALVVLWMLLQTFAQTSLMDWLGDRVDTLLGGWATVPPTDLVVHRGAGAYICGEETALLDALEGKRGNPRLKPPFPAVQGLYGGPTLINNVETLCNTPLIIEKGAEWYRGHGSGNSTGTKIVRVVPSDCGTSLTTAGE